ncbi:MAG: NADH-quinone oxidoreductase subunit L [Bacteroidetes bacterium]|nr:NADH-quinone oxidoreductase subunit L [Bacteroidota bacterium]
MHSLLTLSLAILLLPLFSFVLLIFFGKKFYEKSGHVGTAILGIDFLLTFYVAIQKLTDTTNEVFSYSFTWVDFHSTIPLKLDLGIMLDNVGAVMLMVVLLVSFLVHLFSLGYMKGDVRYSKYYAYLGIFTFSMLGIVLTNNFFLMYMFWELVGLSSYLLIGHWYEKKSAADAGKKAFITNRVGDFGFFIGIMILWFNYSSLSFDHIYSSIAHGILPFGSSGWLTAAGIFIFCGAVGKSAQFPLHVWLPDAMEGPTPVSALIHAATMVAAGVYLVVRTFPMLTADALMIIAYIGAVTAFISATIAIAQYDIKKILAYSTISQLGYMVMGLGVGSYSAGFMHLVTHAAFKAGLFLASGSIIHAMHHALHHVNDHHTDAQDIRFMGGLRKKMPITFWTMIVFTLAISGVPLTSGFLSKDAILAGTLAYNHFTGQTLIPLIGFFVAGLTAFYMFRMIFIVFFGEHHDAHRLEHVHESPRTMTIPLITFAAVSFFAFYSFNPFSAGDGWFFQKTAVPESVVPQAVRAASAEAFGEELHHQHYLAMGLSLTMAALGILTAMLFYYWKKFSADKVVAAVPRLFTFLNNKWYFDELYQKTAVNGTIGIAKLLAWFDAKIIDGIVNGAAWLTRLVAVISGKFDHIVVDGIVNFTAYFTGFFGLVFRRIQTGKVQTYIIFALVGAMVLFYVYR